MVQHDRSARPTPRTSLWPEGRWFAPAWWMSALLHAALIVAVALGLRAMPRTGAAAERTAEVGIALKRQDGRKEFFVSQSDAGRASASQQAAGGAISRDQLFSDADAAPRDPGEVLPSAPRVLGAGALGAEGIGNAAGATGGSSGRAEPGGGKARVRVFGTEGLGYKFVYVFDRSASMGGSGARALRAAKAELLASLESLGPTHQFQIIFYNQTPWPFNPSGQTGRLAFATDRSKELARRFIGGITADGGTRHVEAMMMAIRMHPDVIFLLTDADEPRLTPGEIAEITREAAGITINAIEFGSGPRRDADSFLARLARAGGGQYQYVDVSRLGSD